MKKRYRNKEELISSLINKDDVVLDVGFWGQAVKINDKNWVHRLLISKAKEVYGVDLVYNEIVFGDNSRYKKQSAENFDFKTSFDAIFAGDVIEHLSNPGLFLDACRRNLSKGGRIIITTPNCFNLFNIVEKIIKDEPSVNNDHVAYYNPIVLKKMLEKNGWEVLESSFLDDTEHKYKLSIKRRVLYLLYKFFTLFTYKFMETIVFTARRKE